MPRIKSTQTRVSSKDKLKIKVRAVICFSIFALAALLIPFFQDDRPMQSSPISDDLPTVDVPVQSPNDGQTSMFVYFRHKHF